MNNKQIHIQKYDFDAFEKEQKPFTMIRTNVIQKIGIKHAQEFLLWVYLESLPETWKPNKTHLTHHFNISDRTYERYMSWLNSVGLIEYRQTRTNGGTFGKGRLLVLNGSRFNEDAALCGTVNVDGTAMDKRKKSKLSTENPLSDPPNLSVPIKSRKTPIDIEEKAISPDRQITAVRSNDVHIKTTKTNRKDIRKTNTNLVSVFSNQETVKTHINQLITNRKLSIGDDLVNQIVFYIGDCLVYDEVVKKINIALKKIREGKWNIPTGYQGITAQSIREKEEEYERNKREQYKLEAKAFQQLNEVAKEKTPHISLAVRLAKLKDELDVNPGTMPNENIQNLHQAGR